MQAADGFFGDCCSNEKIWIKRKQKYEILYWTSSSSHKYVNWF